MQVYGWDLDPPPVPHTHYTAQLAAACGQGRPDGAVTDPACCNTIATAADAAASAHVGLTSWLLTLASMQKGCGLCLK
jgi:hypothetical protein